MRRERLQAFKPLYMVGIAGILIGFVYVVRRVRTLWIAQALSLVLVISLVELTCYYYSMFILAAFLSRIRRGFEQAALFCAGASQLLVVNRVISYFYDDRYTAQAALFMVFSIGIVCAFWPAQKKRAASRVDAIPTSATSAGAQVEAKQSA